jgi:myo-inositol 2-dehydrogenase / D-chiro-inositol 1-dehydrogenase
MKASARLGVGILGAGPVTQAIHLPTLARLTDIFQVVTVMDLDPDVARSVAYRVGARATTEIDDLLNDPLVDVVAICSPHRFHASQVIAACRAGKRAVLCEKPFAMSADEAAEITAVSTETGVPIVVGAMHAYDPGWTVLRNNWGDLNANVHTIRSSIVLPPNPRFEDFATEVVARPEPTSSPESAERQALDGQAAADAIQSAVMGLAIHDLPLIRTLLGDDDVEVVSAELLSPFGYLILLRQGARIIELHAMMSPNWSPDWRLEAFSDSAAVSVTFTPSYVQAGSATSQIATAGRTTLFGPFEHNGYEGEWRHLADLARGAAPIVSTSDLIADLAFALDIAGQAADRLRGSSQQKVEV